MSTFDKMYFNNSKRKSRLLTRWVICIPLLVSLLSFTEANHFIPSQVRVPVQTEQKITPAKVGTIVSFLITQKELKVSLSRSHSFRTIIQCYDKILLIRLAVINSKTRFFQNHSRILAFIHTARNTANVIFQA